MTSDQDGNSGRREEIEELVERYGGPWIYGSSAGGFESGLLLLESVRCYRSGADIACMLCAHASCERELAGILRWQVPAMPNSNRWGLGRLIRVGRERNWFGADLEFRLQSVNENRRTLYHLQDFNAPAGLWQRALSAAENPATKDDVGSAIPGTLRRDALEAIDAAFAVRTVEVERNWTSGST
jgi:hypothetical protein